MAFSTQYGTGNPSNQILNNAQSLISPVDSYALYQTGQYQYTLYVDRFLSDKDFKVVYGRKTSGTTTFVDSTRYSWSAENFDSLSLTYPLYCYSNVKSGSQTLDLSKVSSATVSIAVTVTCLFIILKGVLRSCLGNRGFFRSF